MRQALGYPSFEPVAVEDLSTVIPMIYVESPSGREKIVGFDLASSPERLGTALGSISLKKVLMTPPVTLSQDEPNDYQSVLLIGGSDEGRIGFLEYSGINRKLTIVFAASFTPGSAIERIASENSNRLFRLSIIDTSGGQDIEIYQGRQSKSELLIKSVNI